VASAGVSCRCPPPERIIINYAVRALIDLLSSSGRPLSSHHHGGPGSSSRAGHSRPARSGRALLEAFGVAGSTNSLNGLNGGAASPAPSPSPMQPHNSSSSEHWQQQQQQQQQAAAPASSQTVGAAAGGGGSSAMQRAASAASASSVDAGAALAGLGLPGLTDGASTRSRLGQPAGNSRTASDATRALGEDRSSCVSCEQCCCCLPAVGSASSSVEESAAVYHMLCILTFVCSMWCWQSLRADALHIISQSGRPIHVRCPSRCNGRMLIALCVPLQTCLLRIPWSRTTSRRA
jgi:hypothetical protein